MENVRVKELENISNDFLRKLGLGDEEKISSQLPVKTEGNYYYNTTEPNINGDISKKRSLNLPDFSLTKLYKKKNSKIKPLVIIYIYFILYLLLYIVSRCFQTFRSLDPKSFNGKNFK